MNRYGEMARSHWQTWLPERYATISDPDSFFSAIGEEAERQIDELADELAGPGQPGDGYLERAGKLTAARIQAEEIILPQVVLAGPEDTDGSQPPKPPSRLASIRPEHPEWAEVNAEQRERLGLDG